MSEDKDWIGAGCPLLWIPFSQVIEVVNRSLKGNWNWFSNNRCKYINLRIDMRDGHCVLKDRDGQSITIEQLGYQFELEKRV